MQPKFSLTNIPESCLEQSTYQHRVHQSECSHACCYSPVVCTQAITYGTLMYVFNANFCRKSMVLCHAPLSDPPDSGSWALDSSDLLNQFSGRHYGIVCPRMQDSWKQSSRSNIGTTLHLERWILFTMYLSRKSSPFHSALRNLCDGPSTRDWSRTYE